MNIVREMLTMMDYDDVDELAVGARIAIAQDRDAFMPLIINKLGDNRLSVAHTYRSNCDEMRDPEIVFETSGNDWTPVEFHQDPQYHLEDEDGLVLDDFLATWGENIRHQRFLDAIENGNFEIIE